jgi:hypothetical protein
MIRQKENPAANGANQSLIYKNYSTRQRFRNQAPSFAEINSLALSALPALLRRWLPDGMQRGQEYIACNPRRDDRKAGSFKINIRTGRWSDFATRDKGGDIISLAAYLFNIRQSEALRRIAGMLGVQS